MGKRKENKKNSSSGNVESLDSKESDKGVAMTSQKDKDTTTKEEQEPTVTENSDDVEASEHSIESTDPKASFHQKEVSSPMKERGPPMPPWLTSPVARIGRTIASFPMEFDLDASFSSTRSTNFDAPSVVTDLDDESRKREQNYDDEERSMTSTEEKILADELGNQGISLFVEIDDGDASLGDLSELSTSNQSYILDLATQKENREKYLKEEILEESLVLYKEARKAGHGSEAFFLMIVSEVQKKFEVSKSEFFRIQDERLDQALDEELLRRQQELNSSSGTLRSGKGGRQERVDNFIEKEKSRRSMDSSQLEAFMNAASEVAIETNEGGEYDWEEGNTTDDHQSLVKPTTNVKTKKAKKKDKSKKTASGTSKTKKKKSKVVLEASEMEPNGETICQDSTHKTKKISRKKSKLALESIEQPSETINPTENSNDDVSPAKKSKKKKETSTSKKVKKSKKTRTVKEEEQPKTISTHQTTEVNDDSEENLERSETVDPTVSDTNHIQTDAVTSGRDTPPACGSIEALRTESVSQSTSREKVHQTIFESPSSPTRKKRVTKRGCQRSVSETMPPKTKISRLFSSVFHRKSETSGHDHRQRQGLLFRKKNRQSVIDDPTERLLPEPGSQLQYNLDK